MRKIIFTVIVVLASLSIVNSIESIYSLWQKQGVVVQAKQQLVVEQKRNKELTQQLKSVSNQAYVEEEARNKLFMVKPGENTIIIPQDLLASESSKPVITPTPPNWLQWWHLFF